MTSRWALLGAVAVGAALLCVCLGPVTVGPADVLAVLGERLGLDHAPSVRDRAIVWSIRLPRTLLAFAVGGALGLSGAALQGLFRNPLAEPALIGVSSGAALGAVLCIATLPATLPLVGALAVPLAAVVGGGLATVLVYRLGRRDGRTAVGTLLLAGIAVNALAGAIIGLVLTMVDEGRLRTITLWTLGSVGGATWGSALTVATAVAVAVVLVVPAARSLDALLLGEAEAAHLGVPVQSLKRRLVAASTLAVGAATAFSGLVGFVGLVVPHILRLAWGPEHRFLLPASALGGGTLLALADLVARTAAAPAELPIGVLTAILGAPFFLALLRQRGPELA